MGRWKIEGAHRETGRKIETFVVAATQSEAEKIARSEGILISSISSDTANAGIKFFAMAAIALVLIILLVAVTFERWTRKGGYSFAGIPKIEATAKSIANTISTTITKPRAGAISGSCWINREYGSSNIQRGLAVGLFRARANPLGIANYLRPLAKEIQDTLNDDLKSRDDARRGLKPNLDFWSSKVNENTDRLRQVQTAIVQLPEGVDFLAAKEAIENVKGPAITATYLNGTLVWDNNQLTSNPIPPIGTEYFVAQTHTDVDGKYGITGVEPGDYYLYAVVDTKAFFVEWVVPVHVDTDKTTVIDLFNDNALNIKNHPQHLWLFQ